MLKQLLLLVVTCVLVISCGGGDDGGGTPPSTGPYKGIVTGATQSGVIDVTIADTASSFTEGPSSATYAVSGTLVINGAQITLTGTFDDASGAFSVSGGGYTFTGTFSVTGISGSYTGPSGTGQFSMKSNASGTAVHVYCGTYAGSSQGLWNLVDGGDGKVAGNASSGAALDGTRSGNTITLTYSGGSATGTVSGSMVTGTWTSSGGQGTWMGSEAACGG